MTSTIQNASKYLANSCYAIYIYLHTQRKSQKKRQRGGL